MMALIVGPSPTLTALEFPDVTPSTDSPDLVAFKKKVKEVAKRHSTSMHCGSIRTEMKQLGIEDEKKVKVTVVTKHPFTFVVSVEPSILVGKTARNQAAVLAGLIGSVNLSVGSSNGVQAVGLQAITILAEDVVEMTREVQTPGPTVEGITLGARDALRYTSDDGRVLHVWVNALRDEYDDRWESRNSYVYSLCGSGSYANYLQETSSRGTGAHCRKCMARAAARS